jgi:plastocyanin
MRYRALVAAFCLLPALLAAAKDHIIGQKDKSFSKRHVDAKVGDTLTFRNDDPFVHSIFSLSKAQPFDLGPFKTGEVRSVQLAKPGNIVIECAVHPQMKLVVDIAP